MKVRIRFTQNENNIVSETVFAKQIQVKPSIQIRDFDKKDERQIRDYLIAAMGKRQYGKLLKRGNR